MTRINSHDGVYWPETSAVAENEALAAPAALDAIGQDVAPFAGEWLRNVDDMTRASDFSKIHSPTHVPRAPHEQQRDLASVCDKLQHRTDPVSLRLNSVIQMYLQLNREVTFRSG